MNCWEHKNCGREKNGENVDELGICPAYPEHGKRCARVVGTLCGGEVQGTFASKLTDCLKCEFYNSTYYDKHYTGFRRNGEERRLSAFLPSMDLENK